MILLLARDRIRKNLSVPADPVEGANFALIHLPLQYLLEASMLLLPRVYGAGSIL